MLRAALRAPWLRGQSPRAVRHCPQPAAIPTDPVRHAPWVAARRLASADFCVWGAAQKQDRGQRADWGAYLHHAISGAGVWGIAFVADDATRMPWGAFAQRHAAPTAAPWVAAHVADMARLAPWQQSAARHARLWVNHAPAARTADDATHVPWHPFQRRLSPGWGVVMPPDTDPPPATDTVVVPVLRSYIVVNDISLTRVSNNLALPAIALSISADADSWTYTWSATLPGNRLDDALPDSPGAPVEFAASINGWPHRLIAERISLDRRFGQARVMIEGRGLAARLAAPYLASEARDNSAGNRTAAQLCEDALLINNVPASGWSIDWNLTDWLVPAGAWVTLGTPIDAIDAIAGAAGGYLRPHPTSKIIQIEPRYPVAPWDWPAATPDYELPAAAATKVGVEWIENPPYNAVYIAGTGPGAILARVKRAGTAGDHVAPLVSDPLITHASAARQHGTAILGAAGSGQTLTIETPVLAAVGPYPVGSLIKFTDGAQERIGLVRACHLSAELPKVRQTIEVECHA